MEIGFKVEHVGDNTGADNMVQCVFRSFGPEERPCM